MDSRWRLVRRVSCVLLVLLLPLLLFSQIPNASFENWSNDEPDGWFTNNIVPAAVTVRRSTMSNTGAVGLKGTVISYFGLNLAPFVSAGAEGQGFSFTGRPSALRGFYQFAPLGGDSFGVTVVLVKGDSIVVGVGSFTDSLATSGYRQFVANMLYVLPDAPDTALIWMQIFPGAGKIFPSADSYFIVDDLSFGAVTSAKRGTNIPGGFSLRQNFPNPFNPATTIRYDVPTRASVEIRIFNTLGQLVRTLVSGTMEPGSYLATWDGRDNFGRVLPSGTYVYRLAALDKSGSSEYDYSESRTMILLR